MISHSGRRPMTSVAKHRAVSLKLSQRLSAYRCNARVYSLLQTGRSKKRSDPVVRPIEMSDRYEVTR